MKASRNTLLIGLVYLIVGTGPSPAQTQGPAIISPTPWTSLAGTFADFEWDDGGISNISEYWLKVGTGSNNGAYLDTGSLSPSTLSVTVSGLPSDGSNVYATLFHRVTGSSTWYSRTFRYLAAYPYPEFILPRLGTILSTPSVKFTWQVNGSSPLQWWIYAGSSVGASNYYNSGSLSSSIRTQTVSGLPTNLPSGQRIHVRLWYQKPDLTWGTVDYQYATPESNAALTSPPGSILSEAATFSWNSFGSAPTAYWVYVGTTVGSYNLYNSGQLGSGTSSVVASNLVQRGSLIYVRLWAYIGGTWTYRDQWYDTLIPPVVTTPPNTMAFSGSTQLFHWERPDQAIGVTLAEFALGSSPSTSNYHSSFVVPPG